MYQEHQKQKGLEQAFQSIEGAYANPELNEQQRLIQAYRQLSRAGADPKVVQQLGGQLSGLGQKNISNLAGLEADQQRYNVIKSNFGDKVADLYRAAPEGGKTQILGALLEANQRGINPEELLGGFQQNQGQQQGLNEMRQAQSLGDMYDSMNGRPEGKRKPEQFQIEKPPMKTIDYDRGLTPKERVRRQEERYSKNLPLYQESQKKLQGLIAEQDALETLSELSPQIGSFQRLNINPETGELIIPALASPEAQRFAKTVNDFTVKAKDSFGSRVSNFELDRFMKRLPTLANSEEGRRQIIRQMQVISNMNSAREAALQDVFEEYGGVRNIDYDKAERLADNLVKPRIEMLRKEFKTIDRDLDKQFEDKVKDKKKALVPPGRVAVEKDGKLYSLPLNKLKKALKRGYKRV